MTSDVYSVKGLNRDDDEAVNRELSQFVRDYAVVVELLDDPDDDGLAQIRLHSDNEAILNRAVEAVKSRV